MHSASDIERALSATVHAGPATAQLAWVDDFIAEAVEAGAPPDFVSSHLFSLLSISRGISVCYSSQGRTHAPHTHTHAPHTHTHTHTPSLCLRFPPNQKLSSSHINSECGTENSSSGSVQVPNRPMGQRAAAEPRTRRLLRGDPISGEQCTGRWEAARAARNDAVPAD